MTDDLVKRLRYTYEHGIFTAHDNGMQAMPDEAADRIEAQAAEIERLREYLDRIAKAWPIEPTDDWIKLTQPYRDLAKEGLGG